MEELNAQYEKFPKVFYLDRKELDFLQYRVSLVNNRFDGFSHKHEEDQQRIDSILNDVKQLLVMENIK